MSFASLEREVLVEARLAANNPKLRKADLMEWSSGSIEAQEGEVVIKIKAPRPLAGISFAIKKELRK